MHYLASMTDQKCTDLAYHVFKGCRVSGMYCGIPFSGIVTKTRWNTHNINARLVWIDLDYSIPTPSTTELQAGICLEYDSNDYVADTNYIDYIDPSTYPNK